MEEIVPIFKVLIRLTLCDHIISTIELYNTGYILIMYHVNNYGVIIHFRAILNTESSFAIG